MPDGSLHAPASSVDPAADPTASQGHAVQASKQEEELPVAEVPASPSSVAASEFSAQKSTMSPLPGISELADADELTEAELAAAMRAVLSVRKGTKK